MATWSSFSIQLAERWRALDPAWRWSCGVFVTARVLYSLWTVLILMFVPAVTQNLDLFGSPIFATFDLGTSERYVYSRQVGERVLTFRGGENGAVTDNETGSVWSLREGVATGGALAGTSLHGSTITAEEVFPYHGVSAEGGWFGIWQRFDVLWYQAIAEKGYGATAGDAHFPPLFPLMERALGTLLGGRNFLAGWLISQMALVWSLALLYQLTKRWRDAGAARRAVVFAVLLPTAFFYFTAYSESLFLLLSLLVFVMLERERWVWAGVFVFLAILARLQGIALLAPLVYYAWQNWRAGKRVPVEQILMFVFPFAAGLGYLALRAWAGETNILPTSEPQLNARLAPPWENVFYAVRVIASGQFLVADVLNLAATALALLLVVRGWRILPRAYALYSAAMIVVVMLRYVDTQPLNSMTRYLLTLFPLVMLLAYWSKNRWIERAVVYVCAPLNLYLCAQFFMWGWVA